MKRGLIFVGVGIGAGLMYALDPQQGNRRRALARDKLSKAVHKTGHAMGATSRDVANRASGLAASLHARFFEDNAPDDVVEARVRARLGRVASHPHAVSVSAREGQIVLRGPVPATEVSTIAKAVSSVRGVEHVDNRLEPQGQHQAGRRPTPQAESDDWPPAARFAVGLAGTALTTVGVVRRDWLGMLLGGIGVPLVLRAASNIAIERVFASAARLVNSPRRHEAQASAGGGIPIPVKIGPGGGPSPSGPPWPGPSTPGRIH